MHSTFVHARVLVALVGAATGFALTGSASAQTHIAGWGYRVFDSRWTTEPFTDVSSGDTFTLAIRANGQLAAWGYGGMSTPPPPPSGAVYVEVSAASDHALARLDTGALVGWGNNIYGKATPPAGSNFTQISAGAQFSLALRSNGQISAWGSNAYLQLNVPPLPAGLTYTQVSAGYDFAVALRSDGLAVAWGNNSNGQCNVPTLPAGLNYVEVSAGSAFDAHAVARRSDGSVVAWGNNTHGQLNVPALPAGVTYVDIEAGYEKTLALRSDGTVALWPNPSQLPALGGASIVELELGGAGVLRQSNGQLISFGSNYWGESNAPALAAGLSYTKVVAGRESFYALVSDSSVRAWGNTTFHALDVPVLPSGLFFVDLYGGYLGGAGLLNDGTLRFWGDYYAPFFSQSLAIPPGLHYQLADLGTSHAAGLLNDGTIVVWGNNTYGQLAVPALPPGTRYVALAAGSFHTVALRDDGQAVAWGSNSSGQLNVPALPAGVKYVRVAAHERDSGAMRSDGSLVVWGAHPQAPVLAPGVECADLGVFGFHEVDGYGNVFDYGFTMSLQSDGSVSSWGDNPWRQLDLPALPAGNAFRDIDVRGLSAVGLYGPSYGLTASFCTTSLTVGGCSPLISGVGQASASAATPFSVEVGHVDGQRSGILFYGVDNSGFSPQTWAPGSTSVLCVKSPTQRTALQTSGGTNGSCDGLFSLDWNAVVASDPGALGAPFMAGNRVLVQGWFRDPAAPRGTNLSNALDAAIWP